MNNSQAARARVFAWRDTLGRPKRPAPVACASKVLQLIEHGKTSETPSNEPHTVGEFQRAAFRRGLLDCCVD
jgi:hypothetical protein